MSLSSPGVQVTVIDQSQYVTTAANSIPFVLLATATDKLNASGTGVASATTSANANKLYQVTSQRDLVNLFGTPTFYQATDGTPIHGYELNEYGLMATYSLLGTTNLCYVLRADLDLASLVGKLARPSSAYPDGTLWLKWNRLAYTGLKVLTNTAPYYRNISVSIVQYESQLDSAGFPNWAAATGTYAVNPFQISDAPNLTSSYFYRTPSAWVRVGSKDWQRSLATASVQHVTSETETKSLTIYYYRNNNTVAYSKTISVPAGTSTAGLATIINGSGMFEVTASSSGSTLRIHATSEETGAAVRLAGTAIALSTLYIYWNVPTSNTTMTLNYTAPGGTVTPTVISVPANTTREGAISLINTSGVPGISAYLAGGGIRVTTSVSGASITLATVSQTASSLLYKVPEFTIGGQNPPGDLGQVTQLYSFAAGSVWLDTQTSRAGKLSYDVYKMVNGAWKLQSVGFYDSDAAANKGLDVAGGGKNIAADTLYLQFGFNQATGPQRATQASMSCLECAPMYLKARSVVGAADYFGTNTAPVITSGSKLMVSASITGSTTYTDYYELTISTVNGAARGLADAINAHPTLTRYLDASVVNGAIKITHITGGTVLMHDRVLANNASNGVIAAYGLDTSVNADRGPLLSFSYAGVPTTTSGAGIDLTLNVSTYMDAYSITSIPTAGSGYAVGDTVTVAGSVLGGATENALVATVHSVNGSGAVTSLSITTGTSATPVYATALSAWKQVDVLVNDSAPTVNPLDQTIWNYSAVTEIDIMTNVNGTWKGYRNVYFGENGLPDLDDAGVNAGVPATDPAGPIFSASAPTLQSDGTALAYGDLWIDTSDMDNYPIIRRWQMNDLGRSEWTTVDLTDQANPTGIMFADMRWGASGLTDPISDVMPTIAGLLTSNYLDLDAPDAGLYPTGMLAFNTRRSGNNIKKYVVNYFNEQSFPDSTIPVMRDAWVTASGKNSAGVAYFGRRAQRSAVVSALKAAIATNTTIREEDNFFNLIAAPGYPELQPDMVTLNNDRGNTAYIIGDTPMRLDDQATNLSNWAKNAAGATMTGEEGLVTRDEYMGVFYPSGITTDLTGSEIVVPASHMMLRTFIRNDTVAYPWMAAAGTRRGTIDNANNIGYIDAKSGEFQTVKNRVEIRDVLYTNQINPLTFFNGVGLLNYGNKNTKDTSSAMDRTNVARLVAYLRDRVAAAARPFIFEPNDDLTRSQVAQVINSLMMDVVSKRGITEYLVVCDSSNNTAERIDRNELWIDIAVIPTKAVEFVYIPIRLMNTGAI